MIRRRFILYATFFSMVAVFLYCLVNPTFFVEGNSSNSEAKADSVRLRADVEFLANSKPARNHRELAALGESANYIRSQFGPNCDEVEYQDYVVEGDPYQNVVCRFRGTDPEKIVVGAHYDVAWPFPGADDNASGVAGILELSRMLKHSTKSPSNDIELVAYSLEEPPYFDTEHMGSYVHAKSLRDKNSKVKFMISMEMIGYFTDRPDSQDFPAGFLGIFYPNAGNFIAVVSGFSSLGLVRDIKSKMIRSSNIDVRSMNAPQKAFGIGLSDHRNYWVFDYPAVMVTDTSFFRNKNYHEKTDTPDTLDYERMAEVVRGVFGAIND